MDALEFTSFELWWLLRKHAPAAVVGFRNPTRGLLTRDVPNIRNSAEASLIRKEFISRQQNGQLQTSPHLAAWIRAIARPDHIVFTMLAAAPEYLGKAQTYYYYSKGIVSMKETNGDNWTVYPLASSDEVVQNILTQFPDSKSLASPSASFVVPYKIILQDGASNHGRPEATIEELIINGVPEEHARAFWSCLAQPNIRMTAAFWQNLVLTASTITHKFSAIANNQSLWLVQNHGNARDEGLRITLASKEQLVLLLRASVPDRKVQ